jgi:glutamate/tyrosine decarboxylase-like PLP-dependent enzyme
MRPVISPFLVAYLLYKFRYRGESATDNHHESLLEFLVRWVTSIRSLADRTVQDLLLHAAAIPLSTTQPWLATTASVAFYAVQWILRSILSIIGVLLPHAWRLAENLLGIHLAARLFRAVHDSVVGASTLLSSPLAAVSSSFGALIDASLKVTFDFIRFHVPGVQLYLDRQAYGLMKESEDSTFHRDPKRTVIRSLPEDPVPESALLRELEACSASENIRWRRGRVSGTVYVDEATLERQSKLASSVYQLYAYSNPLHPGFWPRMNQAEAEVIQMCGSLLHAPTDSISSSGANGSTGKGVTAEATGCMTSGGTESILLAIRAHVVHYGTRRGIVRPEIICGSTAHAALNKAAEMYGARLVTIDCNPLRRASARLAIRGKTHFLPETAFQLDPELVRDRITANTVMVYASAPSYPQGVVDPIGQLSDLALEYDIGLHVDTCLGGFVLAFLDSSSSHAQDGHEHHPAEAKADKYGMDDPDPCRPALRSNRLTVPIFDFRNAGVTSMSIDPHKYGFSTKGTSVVLYRSRELRHAQYFSYPHWTGGMYATPTLAGSRPGALSVCAWAAMLSIGHRGYRDHADRIVSASQRIAAGIAEIPALRLLTPLDQVSVVVCFGSTDPSSLDIYRISDSMASLGWALNELQNPASIHVCVTLNLCGRKETDDFLRDLRIAVAQVQSEGPAGKSKGTAGIYGAGNVEFRAVLWQLAYTNRVSTHLKLLLSRRCLLISRIVTRRADRMRSERIYRPLIGSVTSLKVIRTART